MLLKRIYDDDLAQASWLVGCQATGEAIVIDPRRDVQVYLDEARREGLRIAHVTETHVHADYLSGARELAAATDARLHLSAEGGPDWSYRFEHEPLRDGDAIRVGNVVLTALHTPGHTPEHLSFLIRDGASAEEPGWIVTGDFVFVGDVGRPDLLDEAAGGVDTRFEGARRLFASLRDRFLTLPDWVRVLPGHGAGSACGKALGSIDSTTVGYERRFAWWADPVRDGDEEGFVNALLEGQPDAPAYFGRMKRQNRGGPALLGPRQPLPRLEGEALRARLDDGAVLLDTRSRDAYARDAVPGSLHVPAGASFASWAAWVLDPEGEPRDVVLLASDREHAHALRDALARIGVDDVAGYATDLDGLPTRPVPTVTPTELERTESPLVLDVRSRSEYEAGHLPGAMRIHGGRLAWSLEALPKDRTIVAHCQTGARSAVAASLLRAEGYDVVELEGGYEAWRKASGDRVGA